jgi:hypothetical protein
MVHSNPKREKKILELWQLGHTIDEIWYQTGIPRSTVGYYVRKFNRNPMMRETRLGGNALHGTEVPPFTESDPRTNDSAPVLALLKIFSLQTLIQKIQDLMGADRYDQLYYLLQSLQLLPKVLKAFDFTPEERATLGTANVTANQPPRRNTSQTPTDVYSDLPPKPTIPVKRREKPIDLVTNEWEDL